jgi:precorrin-6A/cobalt-precorrin-6A reductase
MASKNSGGDSTSAKLSAARDQGIPVYMLQRPQIKQQSGTTTFTSIEHLISQVSTWQQTLMTAPAVSTAI